MSHDRNVTTMTYGRTPRRWIAALTALVVLTGACGGDGGGSAADPSSPAVGPDDRADEPAETAGEPNPFEDAVSEAIGEDGTMPPDVALRIVAATYGDIPGATPGIDTTGMRDAAGAVHVLEHHTDELSEDQRAALTTLLTPDAATLVATIEPDGEAAGEAVGEASGEAAGEIQRVSVARQRSSELEGIAVEANRYIADHFGHELRIPIEVHVEDSSRFHHRGDATLAGPGRLVPADSLTCYIRVAERELTGDADSLRSTVAHEVFHCHQEYFASAESPQWVIEGQAEWVGEMFAGGSPSSAGNWDHWLVRTQTSLLRRGYSAIGFYGALQADGIDTWGALGPMLEAGGGLAPVHAALGLDDTASTLMLGRRLTRAPEHGPEWESDGPGITSTRGTHRLTVGPGAPIGIGQRMPAISTYPVDLTVRPDPDNPLLLVTVEGGAVDLSSTGGDRVLVQGSIALCTTSQSEECTCPGSTAVLPTVDIGSDIVFTLASSTAGETSVDFELISLEDACEAKPGRVPTLRMSGTVSLDLAGGYCWSDGVGYFLWIGAGGSINDIPQPEPYPRAVFRYYAAMSRLGTTTDAGSVSYGLHGDDDLGGGSQFTIATDGLSGTFALADGNAGSYTCPAILTYDEVYGSG